MSNDLEPVPGQWYWHHDKGQHFMVLDADADSVSIQHYDGDVEAMDLDAWREIDIELSEPPEDWTGPVEELDTDDLDYSDAATDRRSWEEWGDEVRRRPEDWANEPETRREESGEAGDESGETGA